MKELIDVFRMTEVSKEVRCRIIIQLGSAINSQFGSNVTEALVYELVKQLDPKHELLSNEHYLKFITPPKMSNTNEELRKKLFGILHDELSASCVGNGVTECTWTVMGKAKVVDLVLAEIKAAERRKTEEVIEWIQSLGHVESDIVAQGVSDAFLTNPER